jgi:hypothetical protein
MKVENDGGVEADDEELDMPARLLRSWLIFWLDEVAPSEEDDPAPVVPGVPEKLFVNSAST